MSDQFPYTTYLHPISKWIVLQVEHKILEELFPRHVLEAMAAQARASLAAPVEQEGEGEEGGLSDGSWAAQQPREGQDSSMALQRVEEEGETLGGSAESYEQRHAGLAVNSMPTLAMQVTVGSDSDGSSPSRSEHEQLAFVGNSGGCDSLAVTASCLPASAAAQQRERSLVTLPGLRGSGASSMAAAAPMEIGAHDGVASPYHRPAAKSTSWRSGFGMGLGSSGGSMGEHQLSSYSEAQHCLPLPSSVGSAPCEASVLGGAPSNKGMASSSGALIAGLQNPMGSAASAAASGTANNYSWHQPHQPNNSTQSTPFGSPPTSSMTLLRRPYSSSQALFPDVDMGSMPSSPRQTMGASSGSAALRPPGGPLMRQTSHGTISESKSRWLRATRAVQAVVSMHGCLVCV